MRPHNLPLVMIGTGLLWFGWFGFNAGSALAANGLAGLAFVNTQVATAAALCGWLIVERIRDGSTSRRWRRVRCGRRPGRHHPACGSVNPDRRHPGRPRRRQRLRLRGHAEEQVRLRRRARRRGRVHLVGGLVGTLLIGFFATDATTGVKSLRGLFYGGARRSSASRPSRPARSWPTRSCSRWSSRTSSSSRSACASPRSRRSPGSTRPSTPRRRTSSSVWEAAGSGSPASPQRQLRRRSGWSREARDRRSSSPSSSMTSRRRWRPSGCRA